ncbi:hypothetical protein Theth_1166 [Pseudothermotoga thermarum DSM 5069]|uniref:Uncharacterized protein n=1 Tax=Pseudothermotoga thermarum DSM 5069 TaxID=688269 RepID=F7YTL6_9THEM|nr:hypothetical protein Theth_1166 [Pseudothermotoga thermarum DSM 5069]
MYFVLFPEALLGLIVVSLILVGVGLIINAKNKKDKK